MRKSSIIENFIKIAEERNILPKVDTTSRQELADFIGLSEAEKTKKAKEIANLYNIKNENADGYKYEYNIVELAHPNPAVVSSAYDKVNGVVENVNERSSIMQDIAIRTPIGNAQPKKYAETQLVMSLVRIANDLDNQNCGNLMVLADTCLEQTSQLEKKAAAVLIGAGIAAAVAVLGGIYAKQHLRFISDGLVADHEKLTKEIADVLEANSNFGVGRDYSPAFIKAMQSLQTDVSDFYKIYKLVVPVLEKLNEPKSGKELLEQAKTSGHEVKDAYDKLSLAANNLMPKLDFLQKNLGNDTYKQMQVKEKGWVTNLAEKSGLLGGMGFVADDMDDVKHAIQTYMKDIGDLIEILKNSGEFAENAKKQLEEQAAKATEAKKPGETPTETAKPGEAPAAQNGPSERDKADEASLNGNGNDPG